MSDTYTTIQDALSDVQKQFMGCVEMHLDPPEEHLPTYAVDALYHCDDSACADLPSPSIRFELTVDDDGEYVSERRHTIEFVAGDGEPARGWVRHTMKRMEALSGRLFWTESRFEVSAPGLPEGTAEQGDVEREVRAFVDKIGTLDRLQKLRAIAAA